LGNYPHPSRPELAADKGYSTLSSNLHAKISIEDIDFSFFNKMKLNGVLVMDQKGDTPLSSGQMRVNITDWFFQG
jgi:hypothetical protein